MKKIAVIALAGASVFALSACGSSDVDLREYRKELYDGRKVTCIVERTGDTNGISCDWENVE